MGVEGGVLLVALWWEILKKEWQGCLNEVELVEHDGEYTQRTDIAHGENEG